MERSPFGAVIDISSRINGVMAFPPPPWWTLFPFKIENFPLVRRDPSDGSVTPPYTGEKCPFIFFATFFPRRLFLSSCADLDEKIQMVVESPFPF